jgi:heterotetrameric sarcosine oxidase gamma subunit
VASTILTAHSPLDAVAGRYGARGDGPDGVQLTVRNGLAVAMIAARNGKLSVVNEALAQVAGVRPPGEPKCVVQGDVVLIGIAPEQWLAVAEGSRASGFVAALTEALGDAASVTDHSSARTVIRISGKRARDTLSKGCAIDLHPRAFTAGSAATTRFAHIGGILWQPEPAQAYEIAVPTSLARSFWSWLTASAGEYGYEVVA